MSLAGGLLGASEALIWTFKNPLAVGFSHRKNQRWPSGAEVSG
jgi:hypothetical protein